MRGVKHTGFVVQTIRILMVLAVIGISGCTSFVTQVAPNPQFDRVSPTIESKKLLVFFDGTANEWNSRTNVRRLFELVASQEIPTIKSLYIEGVGTSYHPLTGGIFGYGMKPRILEGYKYLAKYYKPGDTIYIFGFSRGALQARTLAGLLAYNGLPSDVAEEKDLERTIELIWDFCRHRDDLPDEEWKKWDGKQPVFAEGLIKYVMEKQGEKFHIHPIVANVSFLGVWDTVPGSQFKEYGLYGEAIDDEEGVRYKIQPYPTIKRIAHAMSLDEKRSQFRPVLVRPPIDPKRTVVEEVWFPGAHSDVGGGYDDSNDLAGLSLNWMIGLLTGQGRDGKIDEIKDEKLFVGWKPIVFSSYYGLAHWSIDDKPGNALSKYENRIVPHGARFDESISARRAQTSIPVRFKNKTIKMIPYLPSYRLLSTDETKQMGKVYGHNEE